jgi:two-component system OmpR family response regulator
MTFGITLSGSVPMPCILVVEDDPAVRDLLVEFLGEHGHDIVAVGSAADGRKALAARPAELVITDCVLYGEQGEDFAQHVMDNGVPTILMTGNAHRLQAVQARALAVLQKPFRLADLAQLIARRLDGSG